MNFPLLWKMETQAAVCRTTHAVIRVNEHTSRIVQLVLQSIAMTLVIELVQELAFTVEHLNSIVLIISNEHLPATVKSYVCRPV